MSIIIYSISLFAEKVDTRKQILNANETRITDHVLKRTAKVLSESSSDSKLLNYHSILAMLYIHLPDYPCQ